MVAEHRVGMSALALLPAGILLSAGLDGSLTSWNIRSGKIMRRVLDACPGPMQVGVTDTALQQDCSQQARFASIC